MDHGIITKLTEQGSLRREPPAMKPIRDVLCLALLLLLFAGARQALAQLGGVIAPAGAPPPIGPLPIYDASGNLKTPSHGVVGGCTLSLGSCTVTLAGSAQFTSISTYTCISSDQTLAATLSSISLVSGASFTVYGTLSHVINYTCTGW